MAPFLRLGILHLHCTRHYTAYNNGRAVDDPAAVGVEGCTMFEGAV